MPPGGSQAIRDPGATLAIPVVGVVVASCPKIVVLGKDLCGNATRFKNRGRPVDRSVEAVTAVSKEFRDLIDEGVGHARTISKILNGAQ
jgi:hypothetical protein